MAKQFVKYGMMDSAWLSEDTRTSIDWAAKAIDNGVQAHAANVETYLDARKEAESKYKASALGEELAKLTANFREGLQVIVKAMADKIDRDKRDALERTAMSKVVVPKPESPADAIRFEAVVSRYVDLFRDLGEQPSIVAWIRSAVMARDPEPLIALKALPIMVRDRLLKVKASEDADAIIRRLESQYLAVADPTAWARLNALHELEWRSLHNAGEASKAASVTPTQEQQAAMKARSASWASIIPDEAREQQRTAAELHAKLKNPPPVRSLPKQAA